MERKASVIEPWVGDALNRQKFAEYLTRSLTTQSKQNGRLERGLTVSLDADWGAGKSFFVKHWAHDLRRDNHPTVYFDAWENDIGDETSVALMAAILQGLDDWKEQVTTTKRVKQKVSLLAKKATRTLRRAILPTATVVAKGVVRKLTGIAVEEIHDVLVGSNGASTSPQTSGGTDKVLDDLFEQRLSEHTSRKETIRRFRTELHDLIALLATDAGAELPLFIFLDELDRCRPLYAMQLLEEVKHLFGINDVVFVVSTNMKQLQYSVRALYGTEFDGARYLRRLFDREYILPPPDNSSYASVVIAPDSYLRHVKVHVWLPASAEDGDPLTSAWKWVVDLFNLDLRSQKQVFGLADEVAKVLYAGDGISCVWLFFLCVVAFKDKDKLDIVASNSLDKAAFATFVRSMGGRDISIEWQHWGGYGMRTRTNANLKFLEVLWFYYEFSVMSRGDVINRFNAMNSQGEFPEELLRGLFDELVNHSQDPGTLRDYLTMVRLAGFITAI